MHNQKSPSSNTLLPAVDQKAVSKRISVEDHLNSDSYKYVPISRTHINAYVCTTVKVSNQIFEAEVQEQ